LFVFGIAVHGTQTFLTKDLRLPQASFTPEDAMALAEGLLEGLQEDSSKPGKCYHDLFGTITNVEAIVADVKAILNKDTAAWTKFANDVQALLTQLKGFSPDCNFTGLISTLESFLTPEGVVVLFKNFIEHIAEVVSDAEALKNCSADYKTCGVKVGSIVRVLIGWHLNDPQLGGYHSDFQSFITGLIGGLSGGQNSKCTQDLGGVEGDLDSLVTDIQKLIKGDVFVISHIYKLAKDIMGSLDSFAPDCNIPALQATLQSLTTVEGWVNTLKNYVSNEAQINASLDGLKSCSSNYTACGTDVGTAFSLLLGWTL
jgi:hypothetical protein